LALKAGGLEVLVSRLQQVFTSSHLDCPTDLTVCLIRSIDLLLAEFRMYFTFITSNEEVVCLSVSSLYKNNFESYV